MRTTVDIPDPIYRRLKSTAALKGCSVKELVLRAVMMELAAAKKGRRRRRVRLPIIESKHPGSLHLTNQKINELLFP